MNKKQRTVDVYDRGATAMAAKFNDIGARVADIEKAFSLIYTENPSVLEIGCGNGRDAKEIVRRTKNYIGIDISAQMIGLARTHVPEAHFEVADIENYDFPTGIDIILSFASLLHSDKEHVKNILSQASEALAPDGIFFISLKRGEYREEGTDTTNEFGTRTWFFYTPELIQELAGPSYTTLEIHEQVFRDEKWFIIILRKSA